jgi:HEAT repeat protein
LPVLPKPQAILACGFLIPLATTKRRKNHMSTTEISGQEPRLTNNTPTCDDPSLSGDRWVGHYKAMLASDQWKDRIKGIEGLASLNTHYAIAPLCSALEDTGLMVRRSAAQALIALGERYAEEILRQMRPLLNRRDPMVRLAAMIVIYRLTLDQSWLEPMERLLSHRYSGLQDLVSLDSSCIPALLRLRGNPIRSSFDHAVSDMGPEAITLLVAALEHPSTRERAVAMLTASGNSSVQAMIELSRHLDPILRCCAVRVIAGFYTQDGYGMYMFQIDDRWLEPVLDRLLDLAYEPIDRDTQRYVITALGNWRSNRAGPALQRFAESGDPALRELAVRALGSIRDRYATSLLREIVRDERGVIRRHAITALRRIADPVCVPELIGALDDPSGSTRQEAVRALATISSPDAIKALLRVMQHPDRRLAKLAANRFPHMDGPGLHEAVPMLSRLLLMTRKFDGARVCDMAARLLRRIGTPEALAALEEWQR